ncbi:MAG: RagB/SusD family nutrient uptake outer membrane protein [Flavisolibacter sp.]|nr:RagB/SusD family nutrient uptake outer membrane protein [Flavisolibacter sp.]
MKYSYLYKLVIVSCFTAAILVISCKKDLDKVNPSYPTLESYFKNSSELEKATNAVYSIFHGGALVAREWFFLNDLRSDEVAAGGGQLEVPRNQILIGATTADNPVMTNVWSGLYTTIHRANTVILNAPNVTDNTALRDRNIAEAKFFRGWAYFELVTNWGPVPLYTKPVSSPSDFQPRAPEDQVYNQIIADLKDAAAVLPPSFSGANLGRVTKGAANAQLGRVYMQKGDYANAKTVLLDVYNSGLYDINSVPYINNFLEETEFNKESIWEAVFVENVRNSFNWGYQGDIAGGQSQGTTRNQEYSPITWRNLIPSNKYLNEFENTATGAAKTDPRFAMSVYQSGDKYNNDQSVLTDADQNGNASVVNGVTKKISWRKFMTIYKYGKTAAEGGPDRAGGGNNQRMIRFAEVILMLAECEAELGNLAQAVIYLNQIRNRPGVEMPNYPTAQFPTGTKPQVIAAIMHEKMVELGDEEIRNRDILRWRKKGYFTSDPLPYFRANRDELLPVPQQEIDNNPKLGEGGINKQNPGY